MSTKLHTPEDVAEMLKLDVETFLALKKRNGWVGVKFGRFNLRFTDAQVADIVAKHTETPQAGIRPTAPLPGQTARSAARSAS